MNQVILMCMIIFSSNLCLAQTFKRFDDKICDQDDYFKNILKPEIESKASVVNNIIDLILNSDERHKTYEELAEYVDTFGARLTGSEALENSTNYLIEKLNKQKITDITTENVAVPKWVRGSEWARMEQPRGQQLNVLGLVGSIPTPEDGITTELVVFQTLEELKRVSNDWIESKIILFDTNEVNGSNDRFKFEATQLVAKAKGLAVLFKSSAKGMAYSTQAGVIRYYSRDLQIPAASIASEDSEMLYRMSKRGAKIVINLHLESTFHGMSQSRNLMAELKGTQYPNQMVLISAQLDSWDIGQGAIDDGGGVLIAIRAMSLLNKLGLKPKRTLKMVLFTGEEVGRYGSKAYIERHKDMLENISLIMSSDFGTFLPLGLTFTSTNTRSQCIVQQILRLFSNINSTELVIGNGYDLIHGHTNQFIDEGVPVAGLLTDNRKYMYYPHTSADTISAINPYFLDLCTILWTASSYVLADLSIKLPKDN